MSTCTVRDWYVCERETFEKFSKAMYRLMKALKMEMEALKFKEEAFEIRANGIHWLTKALKIVKGALKSKQKAHDRAKEAFPGEKEPFLERIRLRLANKRSRADKQPNLDYTRHEDAMRETESASLGP